jgi:hypothetical protein
VPRLRPVPATSDRRPAVPVVDASSENGLSAPNKEPATTKNHLTEKLPYKSERTLGPDIDAGDPGMRVRRANHIGIGLARQVHVIGIPAGADIQALAQPVLCVAQGWSPIKNGLRRLRSSSWQAGVSGLSAQAVSGDSTLTRRPPTA